MKLYHSIAEGMLPFNVIDFLEAGPVRRKLAAWFTQPANVVSDGLVVKSIDVSVHLGFEI